MEYTHLPRKIENPYWGNHEKTQVICEFNYEGGPVVTAAVSDTNDGNPDWKEIFSIWTPEELDDLTKKVVAEEDDSKIKQRKAQLDDLERMKSDGLFAAKLKAFEINVIKISQIQNFNSKYVKQKI